MSSSGILVTGICGLPELFKKQLGAQELARKQKSVTPIRRLKDEVRSGLLTERRRLQALAPGTLGIYRCRGQTMRLLPNEMARWTSDMPAQA